MTPCPLLACRIHQLHADGCALEDIAAALTLPLEDVAEHLSDEIAREAAARAGQPERRKDRRVRPRVPRPLLVAALLVAVGGVSEAQTTLEWISIPLSPASTNAAGIAMLGTACTQVHGLQTRRQIEALERVYVKHDERILGLEKSLVAAWVALVLSVALIWKRLPVALVLAFCLSLAGSLEAKPRTLPGDGLPRVKRQSARSAPATTGTTGCEDALPMGVILTDDHGCAFRIWVRRDASGRLVVEEFQRESTGGKR